MEVKGSSGPASSSGRRLLIGGNVAIAIVAAIALVGVVQAFAYKGLTSVRWDMTSSGVNSLSEGTTNLLRGLEKNLRVTSLYFETDREEADQPRYRQAANNLLDLYETGNASKITTEWINPLKDREKFTALTNRLRGLAMYKEDIDKHTARIDEYKNKLDAQIRALVQEELGQIKSLGGGLGGSDQKTTTVIAPLENLFTQLMNEAEVSREQVDALSLAENVQFSATTGEISGLYRKVSKGLKDGGGYAAKEGAQGASLPAVAADFLRAASGRYAELVGALEGEITKLQELQPPKVEEILSQLGPTGNPIVVETDTEALVIDFSSIWPPVDQGAGTKAHFEQRAFKGEEKLTAAILRATHKEQTAVVFVRYGGMPLFMGGFMPGQPPAPYSAMKQQLEDANFIVQEWDLKAAETMPPIEPTPTRTIFVVMKPTPPDRGQFGQPPQEPPFGESQKQALLTAMGDKPRAMFIAGWAPGPFGPIASTYEYNDYLKKTWGVEVDTSALLIETTSFEPGKYTVARRDFFNMTEPDLGSHPIVSGASARVLALPWCAPLKLDDPAPEGVTRDVLITQPAQDGLWGIKNIQAYQDQMTERQYMTKDAGDLEGPFTLGVAVMKGDAKAVVISARAFAEDQVAFARGMGFGPQGLVVRLLNPGNVGLMVNSLHWLNDNMQFLNIGKPIESAVLRIPGKSTPTGVSTETVVRTLTIFIWPVLALACGGVAWWVRRR